MSKEKHEAWRQMFDYEQTEKFSKPNRNKSKIKSTKIRKIKNNQ